MSGQRTGGPAEGSAEGPAEGRAEGRAERPVLRVISGSATPEEIAAIVAVLSAASGGGDTPAPPPARSLWSDSTRAPGHRIMPGPGAWRASALPR